MIEHAEYKYISFTLEDIKPSTYVWACRNNKSGFKLGVVKWYSPWRQYCYFPSRSTVLNRGCMEDIGDFIGKQMLERKITKLEARDGQTD